MTSQTKTKKTSHRNEINHFVLETTKKKAKCFRRKKNPHQTYAKNENNEMKKQKIASVYFGRQYFVCVCGKKTNFIFRITRTFNYSVQGIRNFKTENSCSWREKWLAKVICPESRTQYFSLSYFYQLMNI